MDLFHDARCPCAYCDLDRSEKAEAVIPRLLAWAGAGAVLLVLLAIGAWLAL